MLFLFAISIIFPYKADAKAFGSECYTVTTGGGASCIVTREIYNHYFLWINYDTSVEIIDIDCSHIVQPE